MLTLALRSLRANRARNVMTALSVAVAMGLLTFFIAAQLHALGLNSMLKGRNNMLVNARNETMPLAREKDVAQIDGIERVIHMFVVVGFSDDKRFEFPVHATTAEYTTISDSWFYCHPEDVERFKGERTGALIGRQTAKDLGLRPGQSFTVKTELGPIPLVVSGICPKGYKSTGILTRYEYFTELFHLQNQVNTLWLGVRPGAPASAIAKRIDDQYKNSESPTVTISSASYLQSASRSLATVPVLLSFAGLIIVFATLLVTANTIAIAVRERTPQFATLRAIGYRRGKILALIVVEFMIVCLVGGAVGAAIPVAVFHDGVKMGGFIYGSVDVPPTLILWVLGASIALSLVASVVPAWRASRLDVVQALRAAA